MPYPVTRPLTALLCFYIAGIVFTIAWWMVPIWILFAFLSIRRLSAVRFFCCVFVGVLCFSFGYARMFYTSHHSIHEGTTLAQYTPLEESEKGSFFATYRDEKGQTGKVYVHRAFGDEKIYQHGVTYKAKGKIVAPREPRTPGDWNEKTWLFSKGVTVVFDLEKQGEKVKDASFVVGKMAALRWSIDHTLQEALHGEEYGLAKALLLGDKSALAKDTYAQVQNMGIAHLFAVSGLHVGFVLMVVLWPMRRFGLDKTPWMLLLAAVSVALYAWLTGLHASVLRAGCMAVLALYLWQRLHYPDGLSLLTIAAWCVLGYAPHTVFDIGFQLSFAIVAALLLWYKPLYAWCGWIKPVCLRQGIATSLVAEVASLPFVAWHFYTFTPWSVVFNLVYIPLCAIVVPLLLVGLSIGLFLPALAPLTLYPASALLFAMLRSLEVLQKSPIHWQHYLGIPNHWAMVLYLLALAGCWYALYGKKRRAFALAALLLVGSVVGMQHREPADFQARILDVGQGSSAIVRTPTGAWLVFDCGPGADTLNRSLKALGVNRVDTIVLSHGDQDHVGGLDHVLRDIPVDYLYTARATLESEAMQACRDFPAHTQFYNVEKESSLIFAGGRLTLTYLDPSDTPQVNANETVACWRTPQFSLLAPGDSNKEALKDFDAKGGKVDVVLVPHHGSRSSLYPAFYQALSPKVAIISCGVHNRFGHPHEEVLQTLEDMDIPHYTTAEYGALDVFANEKGLFIKPYLLPQEKDA